MTDRPAPETEIVLTTCPPRWYPATNQMLCAGTHIFRQEL